MPLSLFVQIVKLFLHLVCKVKIIYRKFEKFCAAYPHRKAKLPKVPKIHMPMSGWFSLFAKSIKTNPGAKFFARKLWGITDFLGP